jgi:hypothetical protein
MSETQTQSASEAPPSKRGFYPREFAAVSAKLVDPEVVVVTLKERKIEVADDPVENMERLVKASGIATQGHAAGLLVELTYGAGLPEGSKFREVKPDELTRALSAGFPHAQIGKRHGPHYLSHARRGRLKGQEHEVVIPFARRQAKVKDAEAASKPAVEAKPATTEGKTDEPAGALLEGLTKAKIEKMDRPELQKLLEGLGKPKGGKTPELRARDLEALPG